MLAIDTNVVVRYVVGDGGEQFGRAVDIVENDEISIALTVVLETERVLRDAYQYSRLRLLAALEKIFGLPTVMLKDQQIVWKAMTLAASGLDFADALHLAQSQGCQAFVTFDKRLIAKAASIDGVTVQAA